MHNGNCYQVKKNQQKHKAFLDMLFKNEKIKQYLKKVLMNEY